MQRALILLNPYGREACQRKLKNRQKMHFFVFLGHSEQFLYTTCSPRFLQKEEPLTKIYLYQLIFKLQLLRIRILNEVNARPV